MSPTQRLRRNGLASDHRTNRLVVAVGALPHAVLDRLDGNVAADSHRDALQGWVYSNDSSPGRKEAIATTVPVTQNRWLNRRPEWPFAHRG